jgi:hypothetical protein
MQKKHLLPIGALAVAALFQTSSAQVYWIDGNTDSAFESPAGAGLVPDGWSVFGALSAVNTDTVANGGQVFEGNQSVHISGGSQGISRAGTFATAGEYHWMFYDDMDASKNVRVGLTRLGVADTAPRFGAIAVESNQSGVNYTAHHGFGFTVTSVARSEGWRHMNLSWNVVGGNTVVEYYIDGVLGHTFNHTGTVTPNLEWVGAPFASGSGAWVDMTVVPEPSTLALGIFGGSSLLVGYLRRRKTM